MAVARMSDKLKRLNFVVSPIFFLVAIVLCPLWEDLLGVLHDQR